jgi:transcriptional regulator with XRE-family HTH domain
VAAKARKNGGAAARAGGERHVALGERLREERNRCGLSLRELARRLEVSPSLVSQIETGKIQPSVRTLYAMVSELGVSLDDVFGSAAPERVQLDDSTAGRTRVGPDGGSSDVGPVQRADSRTVIDLEAGVRWERLTTENERGVEFLLTVYPAGSESASPDALVRHTGREFGIVLSGHLRVTVGFEDYELGPGDSVSFDSTVPHRLHNEGDETVEAVWVVLGRQR